MTSEKRQPLSKKKIEKLLNKGDKAIAKGKNEKAKRLFEQVIAALEADKDRR